MGIHNTTKQKILLLLYAGVALGLTYSPKRQFRIIKALAKEWRKLDQQKLHRNIQELYTANFIAVKKNSNGDLYTLTKKGEMRAILYHFQNLKITKHPWDKKWRIVIFDIPEKLRSGRDALRRKLRELGFYEFQKSAFLFPYACESEIHFIIDFFNLRPYVRYGVLESIDDDLTLKSQFHLG